MICKNCGWTFEDDFCPNCGAPKEQEDPLFEAQNNVIGNIENNKKSRKEYRLLGFRSNKAWKKVISILYMIIIGFFSIVYFSTIDSINDAITSVEGLMMLVSPYVFLSNFKIRKFLPLFKENKKSKSFIGLVCVNILIILICHMINPATYCEHNWIETEKVDATCMESGYIDLHCDLCDSEKTEYIEENGHTFEITEEKGFKVCSVCGEKEYEKENHEEETKDKHFDSQQNETTKKQEHKHTWEKATCEKPSICKACKATKGDALGHSTDCGICERCNKEFRKQSPITILNWTHNIDYVGGVEWNFKIRNNTDKQIKYVTLKWDCYNAVGDLIYDDVSWQSYVKVKFTGPLDAHATSESKRNTTKFYNYNLHSYKLTEATVEYMDGTTEKITQYHDGILE